MNQQPENPASPVSQPPSASLDVLLGDLRSLIGTTRGRMAQAINSEPVMLHWHVGERIRRDILGGGRAEYGQRVVSTPAASRTQEYGKNFSAKSLLRMIQFAERFSDAQIVATLSRELGWSHFRELLPLKDDLQRDFYAEMCRVERWSARRFHASPMKSSVRNWLCCGPKIASLPA